VRGIHHGISGMAEFGTGGKKLELTSKKVNQLLGAERINLILLEDVCQITVEVLTDAASTGEDTEAPTTDEEGKIEVILTPSGYADFSDKAYSRKVHRYVKSASRGGFLCWFKRIEFESNANQGSRQRIRNALDRVKKDFPLVETILQRVDMHWTQPETNKGSKSTTTSSSSSSSSSSGKPDDTSSSSSSLPVPLGRIVDAATGDENRADRIPSLCLCVLPAATTAPGPGPGPGLGGLEADAQLDSAIEWLRLAKEKDWKINDICVGVGAGAGAGAGVTSVFGRQASAGGIDNAPAPRSLKELEAFRKLNTHQRNKVRASTRDKDKDK